MWVGRYFADKARLSDDNNELRRSLIAQAPLAEAVPRLREENAQLKALLDMQGRYAAAATAVEVLYTGRDPFTQKLFVNKGTQAGLASGEAVVDDRGVVGQVTRAFPYMAEVTLVTDRDQAVPVKIERNGIRSVLFGNGTGRAPELRFTAPSADVKVGDRLLTSGIDGTYPPNLPVAEVIDIERDTGQMFARIAVRPLGGIDRSQYLLVLAQAAASPPRPEEPSESDTVKRGKGRNRRG
jgi:rod shape-determining protein MreC